MPRQPITINSRLVEEMSRIIALLLLGSTLVFVSFVQRPALASSPPPCTYMYYATGVTQTLNLTPHHSRKAKAVCGISRAREA